MNLADLLDAEQARITAGTATACGYTCSCHGALACSRATHPDVPDNRTVHLTYVDTDDDPGLIQWVGGCCDGEPDNPTA